MDKPTSSVTKILEKPIENILFETFFVPFPPIFRVGPHSLARVKTGKKGECQVNMFAVSQRLTHKAHIDFQRREEARRR